jgi:hypothetical protein
MIAVSFIFMIGCNSRARLQADRQSACSRLNDLVVKTLVERARYLLELKIQIRLE